MPASSDLPPSPIPPASRILPSANERQTVDAIVGLLEDCGRDGNDCESSDCEVAVVLEWACMFLPALSFKPRPVISETSLPGFPITEYASKPVNSKLLPGHVCHSLQGFLH